MIFIIVTSLLYHQEKENTIHEAEKRMDIFMKKWKALFDYVEAEQKKVIYEFQRKGILDKDFFDPHILSFTFISREIQRRYEKEELANGIIPYYYSLASTNPRNPVNKATEYEAEILEKFGRNEIKTYSEVVDKESNRFYRSYMPLERTGESCMKCHGSPDRAPKDLVDMYGAVAGFGEEVGWIRAMVVIEIPIDEIEKEAFRKFASTSVVLLIIFAGSFVFISILVQKERELQKANAELQSLSRTDGYCKSSPIRHHP
ncbi:MAG: DUF3365 domain-containing protein [Desulfobacteraceae bacterium]|nr:DUF3365 domain-containing protein [Desulfobacteraceae bacterium]